MGINVNVDSKSYLFRNGKHVGSKCIKNSRGFNLTIRVKTHERSRTRTKEVRHVRTILSDISILKFARDDYTVVRFNAVRGPFIRETASPDAARLVMRASGGGGAKRGEKDLVIGHLKS